MMNRSLPAQSLLPVALLVPVLIFPGCRASSTVTTDTAPPEASGVVRVVQPGAPGEPGRTVTNEELATRPQPGYTEADAQFMQGMIAHHAQALEMTDLVPSRTEDEGFRMLARRIEVSQASEIKLMQAWLADRGEDVPQVPADHGEMMHGHHAHGGAHEMRMPGMLTPEQMAELAAATGVAFEKLFLTYMISHHEGALVMVADLFSVDGAGQDSAIYRFATDVDADQRMEIRRMRAMLEARR